MLGRRKLLGTLLTGLVAAPMVVRDYSILMPVRRIIPGWSAPILIAKMSYNIEDGSWLTIWRHPLYPEPPQLRRRLAA